jgi:predicted DNA-binding transcriptional regulator YafY
MNRIDRLLAIILHLQARRVTRAEDLAAHFETSLRTIYRDIAALGEAGVPIVAEAGVGYGLMKGYHLPPISFTPEEASALATGGMLVEKFADASVVAPMRSALTKIRAILPRERQDQLARLQESFASVCHGAAEGEVEHGNLFQIQTALAQRRVIRLAYRGAGQQELTERDVEPLGLLHYLDRWHLVAWCRLRSDYRDFRTDRIAELKVLGETFPTRDGFNLKEFVEQQTKPEKEFLVRVKFTALAAERARREWSCRVADEQRHRDGVVLTLRTGSLDWVANWLLSFGRSATILEPEELRRSVLQAAHEAATHHSVENDPTFTLLT